MDPAFQGDDEDLLVPSGAVLEDIENLVRDDSLNYLFEADASFFPQFLILFFIPEDHVRIVLQSIYVVKLQGIVYAGVQGPILWNTVFRLEPA